jgi:hypothetical protein
VQSLESPVTFKSGLDYTYLCTKPGVVQDTAETKTNYTPKTFKDRLILLNALPEIFLLIDSGMYPPCSPFVEHSTNPAEAVRRGLLQLTAAHGRASHMEKSIKARLKVVESETCNEITRVVVDILMCPSGNSYYSDDSPTTCVWRPFLKATRKGTRFKLSSNTQRV